MLVSLHVLAAACSRSRGVLPDRISASPGSAAALFPRAQVGQRNWPPDPACQVSGAVLKYGASLNLAPAFGAFRILPYIPS